jgi:protocatechuate 3,4-dioxygenase beta subunit
MLFAFSFLVSVPSLGQAPVQTAQREKCVVTGRVTNALTGEPVKKADVHLDYTNQKMRMSGPQGYGGQADADGRFRFEAVEPGEYSLTADRPGFLRSSYGSRAPNQAGTNLALAPGQQVSDLNVRLFPQAAISGRVVDEDGDPVEARVQIYVAQWGHGRQRVQPRGGSMSDDLGEYRISNLRPGKYYVCAEAGFRMGTSELPAIPGKPDVRQVRTFFPDATSTESAAAIQVQTGQNLTGIDIRLRTLTTYHVRGRIAGALSRTSLQGLGVSISPRESGITVFLEGGNLSKKGTFDLGGVPTGSYALNLYEESGDFHMLGTTPVEVSGSDVNDVVINVVPTGKLRGRIQVEGAAPGTSEAPNLTSVRVALQGADEGAYGWGEVYPKSDGSFAIENLNPGKYNVNLFQTLDGTYIKSVQLGQQEMLGKELDFSQGVSGELLVTLSYGVADVSGTVQMPQQDTGSEASSNKPVSAASIALVPEELRPDGSGLQYGNTTQTGTFSIKNVPPGRYRAYALEELKRDQMDNPDFLKQLESNAVEIEVKENDKKTTQLTLIPATETQRILAQLGIDAQ